MKRIKWSLFFALACFSVSTLSSCEPSKIVLSMNNYTDYFSVIFGTHEPSGQFAFSVSIVTQDLKTYETVTPIYISGSFKFIFGKINALTGEYYDGVTRYLPVSFSWSGTINMVEEVYIDTSHYEAEYRPSGSGYELIPGANDVVDETVTNLSGTIQLVK